MKLQQSKTFAKIQETVEKYKVFFTKNVKWVRKHQSELEALGYKIEGTRDQQERKSYSSGVSVMIYR